MVGSQLGRLLRCLAAGLLLAFSSSAALGETYRVTPQDDWFAVIAGDRLQPGDEVVLAAGTYRDPRRLALQHRGTAAAPIVIRGAAPGTVLFHRPDARQNSFNLEGAQHLQLRDFAITGGAAAIRIGTDDDKPVRGIVLEGLHLHHLGGVAVTCNQPGAVYEGLTFRQNHIHHTGGHGEAFYLGGNHASAIFHDSLIVENYLHDLRGPEVSQGDGIEIKQGSYGNRILRNVIHDTGFPGVIVYGTAGQAVNRIENNLIWNSGDHGIQAAADAEIIGNWIADPGGVGIYSRQHQGAQPGNLTIRANQVFAGSGPGLRLQRPDGAPAYRAPIVIRDNLFWGPEEGIAVRVEPGRQLRFQGNRGRGAVQGIAVSPAAWQTSPGERPPFPAWAGHRAWEHLDQAAVAARFRLRAP